jgi:hypothetical protein
MKAKHLKAETPERTRIAVATEEITDFGSAHRLSLAIREVAAATGRIRMET